MRKNLSNEHLEDATILAYIDGELSRAATRRAKLHMYSCWKCRSVAAELERLVQTASKILTGRDDVDTAEAEKAKGEFLRRKAAIDVTWIKKLRCNTSMLFQGSLTAVGAIASA